MHVIALAQYAADAIVKYRLIRLTPFEIHSHSITPRFGAVRKQGSIAIVERFIKTLKNEGTRCIPVPKRHDAFQHELRLVTALSLFNPLRCSSPALVGCAAIQHRVRTMASRILFGVYGLSAQADVPPRCWHLNVMKTTGATN